MENVVHLGLTQHFKNAEEYLSYVEKKHGPFYVRAIQDFTKDVIFEDTYNKTIDARIVGGEVIRDAGNADIFNLCSVAIENRLKVASNVVPLLLFLELLDKPLLMKRYHNLYVIVGGIPAKVSGHLGVSLWCGGEIPNVSNFCYSNLSFPSFIEGAGFVFEVLDTEVVPAGYDRA